MKKQLFCIIAVSVTFFLIACKKEAPPEIPAAIAAGYSAMGTILSGGTSGEDAGDINAKSLRVTTNQNGGETETILEFAFVTGSRMSGSEEEAEGCGVPRYTLFSYDYPARLVVQFENLAFWDYRHGLSLETPLLHGTFQQSVFGSPKISICFQLSQPVYFRAETGGDVLRIHLLPKTEPEGNENNTRYYVTANAYDAYRSGAISLEFSSAPTFAKDMQNILLISPPMQTETEAEEYLNSAKRTHPAIPEEVWRIEALSGQSLPTYDSRLDYLTAFQTPAVRLTDGSLRTLPVLIPDGLFLAPLPGSNGVLYSKELPISEGGATYQQLMRMQPDATGNLTSAPVMEFEFAAIEAAGFSPDGRRLAVLENSEGGSHLYVFDADTYELLNDLSEMGFGSNTGSFIWNSLGSTIYAIAGPSGSQLHQFDYSIPDETQRHSLVDSNSVDEGSLAYRDGELYFALSSMEEGSRIYRIKPEGGVRKPFIPGGRFHISPDASCMAILNSVEATDEGRTKNSLTLYEFATGATKTITDAFSPYDCIWSEDSTKLYYIESRVTGGQTEEDTSGIVDEEPDDESAAESESAETEAVSNEDPFPFTLWMYDIISGANTRLLDLVSPDLTATRFPNVLYLNRYEADINGAALRTTYLLDFNTVFQPEEVTNEDTGAASDSGENDVLNLGD